MILIVDDRPENILPLKDFLEQHHFRIDTAGSGEEALKKILHNRYSLIILDVQMPGMDGFEVAEAIAGFNRAKDTPIIFLSAVNTEKKFITKGYTSGGIDYLTKPVDLDILLLKVKTFNKLYEQQQDLMLVQDSLRTEIEQRKKAQEELAAYTQELRAVIESLPLITFTVATDGKIEYVNEHWYKYSRDAGTFPEAHPDDHHICLSWEDHFKKGTEFSGELRIQNLESLEYRYFLLRIIPVEKQGSLIRWVGTFTDINQQKMNTEILEQEVKFRTKELLLKNAELESTNHELQQFAWVVSHDLKEPLRKIQTFNNIVKEQFLAGNDKASSYLERSINSSARMSKLINDLLDYSRLSVSSMLERTDLNDLVSELLSDYDNLILQKQAVIEVEELPVIDAISSRIRQVFQNLISNALKFSRPDITPLISIRSERISEKSIDSPADEQGKYCRITISDNGIGFDEQYLDRIFVIFQRLNTQSSYEGTGIGLAIAKKIMDSHGGLISARSKENEGTSFILVLPLNQQQAQDLNLKNI